MTFSKTHLDEINGSQAGQLAIARHPNRPEVLVTIVGTSVVLGLTLEQVDHVIDTLTIMRDRIVHEDRPNLPKRSTPIPSVH